MFTVEELSNLLLEEQYPSLSDEQLQALCDMYDNINQACYMGCKMKARVDKIKIACIEIESNSSFWLDLAESFYQQWQDDLRRESSKSRTGLSIGRVDEY